jgi:hypothetical protein
MRHALASHIVLLTVISCLIIKINLVLEVKLMDPRHMKPFSKWKTIF